MGPELSTLIRRPLPATFRQYLQEELNARCRRNNNYSLRAFAHALAIPHSSLSRMLRAERAISARTQKRLADRLGLGPDQLAQFQLPSPRRMKCEFRRIELDQFAVIADWYHSAILELTQVKGFRSEPRWIARRLGITVAEVNTAFERLLSLGMLERKKNGRLVNVVGSQTSLSSSAHTSAAQRRLQNQVLKMAIAALEEVPIEKRTQSSVTLAINTKRIPEALECIRRFRRDISKLLEQDSERDEVYHLSVSLYPITHPLNTGGK